MSHDTQRLATLDAVELADALESWKASHVEVQRCWEIEDRRTIKKSLRRLERVCGRIDRSIRWLEQRSYKVEGSAEFRRLWTILELDVQTCGLPDPRPVRVEPDGRLFEMAGTPIVIPGLEPEKIGQGFAEIEAGRTRPRKDVLAELGLRR